MPVQDGVSPFTAGRRMQPLTKALDADRHEFAGRAGVLSYYFAGKGPPMLLLHSINAAGSAYEVRPIFENYRDRYRVYAPDLPGFGFSERSKRRYDIPLYVSTIEEMLRRIGDECPEQPVNALALSLSSEFLAPSARTAAE